MSYLEELLPEFRKGAKIRRKDWDKDNYLVLYRESIITKSGNVYEFYSFDFLVDDWEFYQEPIDWQYIIDNKCLCYFWDDNERVKIPGFLTEYIKYDTLLHYEKDGSLQYKNCRPVRRDEVTFCEDKDND